MRHNKSFDHAGRWRQNIHEFLQAQGDRVLYFIESAAGSYAMAESGSRVYRDGRTVKTGRAA